MPRNRFARSFAVSMVAVLVVFAIPLTLTHCSTNTMPGTDTGVRAKSLAAGESAGCSPNSNPNNPVICISANGMATPEVLKMNNHDHESGNPIIWRADGGGTLSLNMKCPQIETPNCNGPICIAKTNPTTTGTCTYTATVNGVTGADPIIVTDQCCPSPGTENPKP